MSVVTKESNPELYNALFPEDEIKEIDITKDLYLCSPLLNTECSKENCYINNGSCCHTVIKEHSQQHLLDYITNLQKKYERMKENAEILSNGCNELEQRNEKAIEYIKKHCDYGYLGQKCLTDVLYRYEAEELLEILQGSDNSECN